MAAVTICSDFGASTHKSLHTVDIPDYKFPPSEKQQPLMGKERRGEKGEKEKRKEKRKGVRSGQNNSKSIKMKSHLE